MMNRIIKMRVKILKKIGIKETNKEFSG